MTPETWRRITDLFHEALDLPPELRASHLAALSPDDEPHRAAVEALLAANDSNDAFLETPAAHLGSPQDVLPPPPRLGPWSVEKEIGRGGMGAVYLVSRADAAYEQRAALKLVRADALTWDARRRFVTERQILARLSHPHIAHLLDGGTSPDGRPFLVLEYVDGLPITEYADRRGISVEMRLRLFLEVAAAIAYAHRNLVVHSDIKPSNILVTADGSPKLLDFGIAKLLSADLAGDVTTTVAALRVLTPEYASPEQVRGEPVTTLSDVYSLGVVLFELLTGQRPLRVTSGSLREIERIVGEEQPPLPSAVKPGLSRDLDAIVLMAIRKEPERRYVSVERLAEDVANHLDGRPVLARSSTASYRLRRFVTRHKAGAAAVLLVFLSIAAGGVATIREARIAEAQRARAEKRVIDLHKLSNALLFDIYGTVESLPGSLPAREALVKKALEYLGTLAKESAGSPGLSRDLASAYQKVGEIQGDPFFANLGDTAGCLASLRTALEIREELLLGDPDNVDLERERNAGLDNIGAVLSWTGDVAGGLATLRRTQESRRRLAGRFPDDRKIQRELAFSASNVGDALWRSGDRPAALASLTAARTILEPLAREQPDDRRTFRSVVIAQGKVATLLSENGDLKGAIAALEASVADLRTWLGRQPHDAEVQRDLAITLNKIGGCRLEAGATGPSVAAYREALVMVESLAAADPKDVRGRSDLAYTRVRLGVALVADGDASGAERSFGGAVADAETFLATSPKDLFVRDVLGNSLSEWGALLARRGDRAGARAKLERALSISEILVVEDSKTTYYKELGEKTRTRIAALGNIRNADR